MDEHQYNPAGNAGEWISFWDEHRVHEADGLTGPKSDRRPRTYVVNMLPYPSGDLHMGHAEAYSIGDAIARFSRMRGHDVLNPIGWDSFGLPAENAAIRRGLDPREWTYTNIETQARSFRRLGISFDWRTRLHTSDPEFYRWNQWLFLRMYERGLAYRATAPVNWCPNDRTVLANEQVIDHRCERCGTLVVQRELTQWFLRITAYADRLLADMNQLEGRWPADVLAMQRNWIGRKEEPDGVTYRLRDWLVSRQRYWGTPIPIVHCPSCGLVPVPDDDLPVRLPSRRPDSRQDGGSPLAGASDWVTVRCPACGGPARRDTDTMDTFVDSSWYFLRYPNPDYQDGPFDPAGIATWLPVDEYIGGKEHATGHLLYARFVTKVLHDMGLVPFTEPFVLLTNQGQVIMNGQAMSKSRGNLIALHEQMDRYGPDAVRVTMMFAGPPEDDIDWADVSVSGAVKWLARVWRLAGDVGRAEGSSAAVAGSVELRRDVHRLTDQVTGLIEGRRLNVAIARLMELTSLLRRSVYGSPGPSDPAVQEGTSALIRMVSCFAPFTAEDSWQRLGRAPSVAAQPWPDTDPILLEADEVTCVIQIDGKVRARILVPRDIGTGELRALALAEPAVVEMLTGTEVRKVVVRPPRLVNIVPEH